MLVVGDQSTIQTTGEDAVMRQHQGDELAERQRERTVLRHDLFPPVQGSVRCLHNGTSFGLNDLETLMNVACEAKEWMTAHALNR